MARDPFYNTAEWRNLRARYLAAHPVCEVPGCGEKSSHVDHRLPIKAGGAKTDRRNLQALCHSHHSSKTAQGDGGFGNRRKVVKLRVKGADVNGWPLDPEHHWNKR